MQKIKTFVSFPFRPILKATKGQELSWETHSTSESLIAFALFYLPHVLGFIRTHNRSLDPNIAKLREGPGTVLRRVESDTRGQHLISLHQIDLLIGLINTGVVLQCTRCPER